MQGEVGLTDSQKNCKRHNYSNYDDWQNVPAKQVVSPASPEIKMQTNIRESLTRYPPAGDDSCDSRHERSRQQNELKQRIRRRNLKQARCYNPSRQPKAPGTQESYAKISYNALALHRLIGQSLTTICQSFVVDQRVYNGTDRYLPGPLSYIS